MKKKIGVRTLRTIVVIAAAAWATSAFATPLMYVNDNAGKLATVDAATGHVNVIGSTNITLTDIAFSPSGQLFGINFHSLYTIDADTAAIALVGDLGVSGANALVFGTDGTLYIADSESTDLFTVNPATGNSTDLGSIGFYSGGDLAFNGGALYLASSSDELVKIDLGNLARTSATGTFGVSRVYGLATAQSGVLYAVAGTNLYKVDTGTAALSNSVSFADQGLGNANGESFFYEAVPNVAVPEPNLLLLFGAGIVGVGFLGWRRKKGPQKNQWGRVIEKEINE